ncbi:FG-GAP repeat domain-containing protein [Streptomyces wuyuanensis]|uniref:FG-GAP repeat domain-containing protein n=1 Tax=Streptomyces wuyuanensis TaxID=1196353 RepID=UPI0037987019
MRRQILQGWLSRLVEQARHLEQSRRVRQAPHVRRALAGTAVAGAMLAGPTATAPPAAAAQPATGATVPASAPARSTPADAVFPAWLVPLFFSHEVHAGANHSCTGVHLSRTRTLAPPDCFTGMSDEDVAWAYDSAGRPTGGSPAPAYRTHPQFDRTTRQAGVAVFYDANPSAAGRAVLAGPSDTHLYTAGAQAVFHSWNRPDGATSTRARHTEHVVVRRTADCAAALGQGIPAGIICTSPAPGGPPVEAGEQCTGDAGGALVSNGKLIAVSATSSDACVKNGLRLYTAVPTYRAVIEGWTRDVDHHDTHPGSVLGREANGKADVLTPAEATRPVDGHGFMNTSGDNFATQAGDLNRNGYTDFLVRSNSGTLYRIPLDAGHVLGARTSLGTGWNRYDRLLAVRDLSGDGQPDVVGRDASGYLWVHPGTGTGGLGARVKIGVGWGQFTAIAGRGDLSGDARPDLLARDGKGDLWLYPGNGRGGFLPRIKAGAGWNSFNAIVASGDFDKDERQDVIGRTSAGAVYLYNVNRTGGFTAPKLITAASWKGYAALG